MILVGASTGKLGRLVIRALLERVPAQEIIAGARSLTKARAFSLYDIDDRDLDYSQPETAEKALSGIDKLLLISGNEPSRVAQHISVVEAAKKNGVKHIAYTSVLHADSAKTLLAKDHADTEAAIRASGIPFTFLRNGWYIENYTDNLESLLRFGLYGATGDQKFSPAARADLAEAAAVVLTSAGHEGKTYELGGDTAYSLSEIAMEISRIAGRSVTYGDLSLIEYKSLLLKLGLPDAFAALLADADLGTARGELLDTSGDLSRLIGRPTTPLATVIEQAIRDNFNIKEKF